MKQHIYAEILAPGYKFFWLLPCSTVFALGAVQYSVAVNAHVVCFLPVQAGNHNSLFYLFL